MADNRKPTKTELDVLRIYLEHTYPKLFMIHCAVEFEAEKFIEKQK